MIGRRICSRNSSQSLLVLTAANLDLPSRPNRKGRTHFCRGQGPIQKLEEISRRGEFHRLAMRCAAIGICPGVLTRYQVVGGDQTALGGQSLERGDSVQIIPRSIVIGVTRQFARQGYRPIRPCEGILGVETYHQREGLGLPRFGKYRPLFVLRQAGECQRIRRAQDRAPKDRG